MFRKQRLGEYISFMFRSANSFDIISNWNTSVGSGSFNGACAIKEASPGKPIVLGHDKILYPRLG